MRIIKEKFIKAGLHAFYVAGTCFFTQLPFSVLPTSDLLRHALYSSAIAGGSAFFIAMKILKIGNGVK